MEKNEVGSDCLRIMCSFSTSKANCISKWALALHVATKINLVEILFSGNSGTTLPWKSVGNRWQWEGEWDTRTKVSLYTFKIFYTCISEVHVCCDYALKNPLHIVNPDYSYVNKRGWHHSHNIAGRGSQESMRKLWTKEGDFLKGAEFKWEYFLEQMTSTWRGDGDQGQQLQFSDSSRVQRAQKGEHEEDSTVDQCLIC